MRTLQWWLLGLGLALVSPAVYPLSGSVVASDNVKARLISETDGIAPGQSIWVALEFDIRDGWHTYWRNPGDSGQATKLKWTLPAGVTAGDIVWTSPASLRNSPAGQLRLRQTRDALGADHGGARPQGRRCTRAAGKGELAGVCRCLHPRKCRPAIAAAGEALGRRHRLTASRRCSPRRAASCRPRSWPRPARGSATAGWC